jgi:patatin-like phospholipase/acyl hydrolase
MPNTFKVLSIDGGGIRGIIPAMVLARIEKLTGRPIAEMFDMIAGTSTGGILALGLTLPSDDGKPRYAAKDLLELYEKDGSRIFPRSVLSRIPVLRRISVSHPIRSVRGVAEEKYSSKGIEGVLQKYFAEARLKDALTRVFVTSYEIQLRQPFFFRSEKAKNEADYDFPMRQVARATSAAPTYFEPAKVEAEEDLVDYYALVDGGVFANNPAMCAYVEARKILDAQGLGLPAETELLMVSLGTGQLTDHLRYEKAKGWGLLEWARPLIDVVFDGVSDTVDFQLKELLPRRDGLRRYYRFQTELGDVSDALDNAEPENVRDLKLLARTVIDSEEESLSELYEQLERNA